MGGILFQEIAAVLANTPDRPGRVRSFIGGLGGKDISQAEFDRVLEALDEDKGGAQDIQPELLFTESDWKQLRKAVAMAGKPVKETS